jgi:ribosomal protein S13
MAWSANIPPLTSLKQPTWLQLGVGAERLDVEVLVRRVVDDIRIDVDVEIASLDEAELEACSEEVCNTEVEVALDLEVDIEMTRLDEDELETCKEEEVCNIEVDVE